MLDAKNKVTEFQYPDGWFMKVGQIYSSPYLTYHAMITEIEKVEGLEEHDCLIHYTWLLPDTHALWLDYDGFEINESAYSWWFNQGVWDLEADN